MDYINDDYFLNPKRNFIINKRTMLETKIVLYRLKYMKKKLYNFFLHFLANIIIYTMY